MQQKGIIISLVFCMLALALVAGCASSKDMGTVKPPTTVTGTGPALIHFQATNPSYSFHVESWGDHAGMIVTISGANKDRNGDIQYDSLAHDAYASGGVDVESSLKGFTRQMYTIEVMTTNDAAPWSIEIRPI